MSSSYLIFSLWLPLIALCSAQTMPPFDGEKLIYSVNWPSGLSLGEAQIESRRTVAGEGSSAGWRFEFRLEAAIPGFAATDQIRSQADGDFCSIEFEKDSVHGKRKAREKISFDPAKGMATRQTIGGGSSQIASGACGRDALAYLYHVRRELAQGRLAGAEPVFFGAAYQMSIQYGGAQRVRTGDTLVDADLLNFTGKGPASTFSFEVLFARDGVRTPLLVKVPLAMGVFTMELVR